MEHVDAVWDRLDFRTPWSKAREHERVRAALARFLAAGTSPTRAQLLDTEARFSTVVELDDGEQVQLTGYADRLELDADGNVVVVDLKTGRTKPSNKAVESHVQLGLYQYAVDHGAVDELAGGEARAGGAELVQLGILDGGPDAVVQPQDAQPEDGPDRTVLRDRLAPHGVAAARRGVPGGRRPALPRLQLRPDLPDQGRRVGDVPVSQPLDIATPDDLARVMKTPYAPSDQQWAAISAPLTPGGRDRRRRLRQDHADGRAGRLPRGDRPGAPRRGARPDLHHQGRQRAAAAGSATPCATAGALEEPTTPTTSRATSSSRRSRRTTPTPPGCSPTTACGSATSPTPG